MVTMRAGDRVWFRKAHHGGRRLPPVPAVVLRVTPRRVCIEVDGQWTFALEENLQPRQDGRDRGADDEMPISDFSVPEVVRRAMTQAMRQREEDEPE